jgi:tripartite-type tricarboxylate transporter receptor subunit TctC
MRTPRWTIGLLLLAASANPSLAQSFPAKPIVLVVPYAPGGNVDVSTRILQAGIGEALGQPIIIENRPGAGGTIAGSYVARAAPDGHTLFVGSTGNILLGPMTMPNPPYQWQQAFTPVSSLALSTNVLLVRPTLPAKAVGELVDYARQNPGKLTVATSSISSINYFMGELLKLKAGITWTDVHYRGNAPIITDLMADHIDASFQQLSDSQQQIEAGKVRALAVLGPRRAAAIGAVPTSTEAGYPDVQGVNFNGIFAPKGTPPEIVAKLSAAIREALQKPAVIEQLARLGSEAPGSTPEEFGQFLQSESEKWTDVMKKADIKIAQ